MSSLEQAAVRLAGPADVPPLTASLVAAFADDPIVTWSFPHPARRPRGASRFFSLALKHHVPQDVTWTAQRGEGGALWALPGRWHRSTIDTLRLCLGCAPSIGRRSPRVAWGLSGVERRHPTAPHLYLAVLGVHPSAQGRGLGSALLAPGLALCDEERLPAYLETGKEENLRFYARHGFRVIDELRLPAGPRVWRMWREPAT